MAITNITERERELSARVEELEAELAAIRAHSPEGPLLDGWQITLSDGHTGYGVYAHMTEYPDEDAIFLLSAGAQPRCPHCDGTGDVHSIDGEWRGVCDCGAGAQPVPEGMAIMPNEPTLEMIDATGATMPDMREMVVADYKAMLAAAKELKCP